MFIIQNTSFEVLVKKPIRAKKAPLIIFTYISKMQFMYIGGLGPPKYGFSEMKSIKTLWMSVNFPKISKM